MIRTLSITFLLIIVLFTTSCVSTPERIYKLYPGPVQADDQLVTANMGIAGWAIIDGFRVNRQDHGEIKLLPGEHQIEWGSGFYISALIDPEMMCEFSSMETLTLDDGLTYVLKADRTTGYGNVRLESLSASQGQDPGQSAYGRIATPQNLLFIPRR